MIVALRHNGPLLALWLLAASILIWLSIDTIVTRAGWDPDDQLRLVQLRDFLNGQSWFDTTQYRLNPPDGAPMHWSRLVEVPLALIVMLFRPLFGQPVAEMVAGTLVPLFCLGGIGYFLAQVAGKIGGRAAGIVAFALVLMAPAMLIQLRPMRIDHHGWQIFCAVLGFASLYWNNQRRSGLILGATLAVWVHISLEGAPLTAAFFIYLGASWTMGREEGRRLPWTLAGFAALSLALFLGTQEKGFGAVQYCDTIAPAHIAAILLGSGLLLPSIRFAPPAPFVRMTILAVAGSAMLALLLWLLPQCSGGAFGDLDPLVREYWYVNISEGLPVWRQEGSVAVTLITPLLMASAALFFAWRIIPADRRPSLAVAGFFLIYSACLSIFVFRTVSVATAFTIVPLAICLTAVGQSYRSEPRLLKRLTLVPLAIMLAVPGMILGPIALKLTPADPDQSSENRVSEDDTSVGGLSCESVGSTKALRQLPRGNIVAPFNLGPAILMTTQHSVLASSHHRNRTGMRDQIDLFRLPPDRAREIARRHAIDFIVICPDDFEMELYQKRAPDGLWAIIKAGKPPSWLAYQGKMGGGLRVWRVVR
jgi:hypothetical protein